VDRLCERFDPLGGQVGYIRERWRLIHHTVVDVGIPEVLLAALDVNRRPAQRIPVLKLAYLDTAQGKLLEFD
jgi:hypothetical protein